MRFMSTLGVRLPPEDPDLPFNRKGSAASMTSFDGLLMIVGFALGCWPIIERLIQPKSLAPEQFRRRRHSLAETPWI